MRSHSSIAAAADDALAELAEAAACELLLADALV
jgi:hypothetical protein